MGLLASDKERIRKYLGYPLDTTQLGRIQERMDIVDAYGATDTVRQYLMQLDKIALQIDETRPFAAIAATSNAASSTTYMPGGRMNDLRTEGRRYVQMLSSTLELHIMRDYFGSNSGGSSLVRS